MGINGGAKCSATIKDAPVASVMSKLREIAAESGQNDAPLPVIDADINWLICSKTSDSDSLRSRAIRAADILESFSRFGCIVNPICDPETRHHSKMASTQRRSNKVAKEALTRASRYKLNQTNQKLSNVRHNSDASDISALNDERKSLEKLAKRSIAPDHSILDIAQLAFKIMTDRDLISTNAHGGRVNAMVSGMFHTDALIAKRFKLGLSHVIVSSDSDFTMLVGKSCIQIKDFSFDNKAKCISYVTLSLSSNDDAKSWQEYIMKSKANPKLKLAEFPFFAEYSDLKTRALIGICLGCDVYPGGCKNVGPPTLNKFLNKYSNEKDDMSKIIGDYAAKK